MHDTKENILQIALRLFARDGYDAVSVSAIAAELGMTKGALYKHYKNKQDIFDSIFERICQSDSERAKKHEVPEEVFGKNPQVYRDISLKNIQRFMEEQFRYWTEDEFACNFRKILILEQYKNPEMAELYQAVFVTGPVRYTEDLFREMMEQGVLCKGDPKQLALALYSPFYLLLSVSDVPAYKQGTSALLTEHIELCIKKFTEYSP